MQTLGVVVQILIMIVLGSAAVGSNLTEQQPEDEVGLCSL
jgi:hypothetical protein